MTNQMIPSVTFRKHIQSNKVVRVYVRKGIMLTVGGAKKEEEEIKHNVRYI